ncbi:MAG TPA: ABC transporter permease [Streptosporangiaceae bacterium]|nr:ABC transporter permease [Streptosporangiaceae bacterium]
MITFLVRRLALGLLVLWVITVAVFVLFFVAPHNVARLIAGKLATPQTVALVSQRLGLNRPVLDQYWSFLDRLGHGNLGYSFYSQEPVSTLLGSRIAVSVSLALGAAVIWVAIGVATGVLAATRPRSLPDRTLTVLSLGFYSMPTFLLGIVVLYLLFYRLHLAGVDIFPGSGYVPLTSDPLEWARHLVLPWLSLALTAAAAYTRLTRASMLDVLGEDFVRTAAAKGLTRNRVIYRHALRAAITPVTTQFGIDLGVLLGGAVVTEQIFGLPGLGQIAVQSILSQDLPVIIAIVTLASAFVVVANIAVDILYAVLDPRVRLE